MVVDHGHQPIVRDGESGRPAKYRHRPAYRWRPRRLGAGFPLAWLFLVHHPLLAKIWGPLVGRCRPRPRGPLAERFRAAVELSGDPADVPVRLATGLDRGEYQGHRGPHLTRVPHG